MQRIQKTISEILRDRPAPAVSPKATVMDAVRAMTSQGLDCVLVVEQGAVVGIFTERDFLNRVAAEGLIPAQTNISDVMTRDPEVLRPDNCISYAIERIATRGYRNVPIVENGRPPAVLTVRDVMKHLSDVLAEVEEADPSDDEYMDFGGGG